MSDLTHIFRFAVVGAWGFILNTVVLIFGVRIGLRPSISGPLGAELAIISNFILNNLWTFSDRSITSLSDISIKFIEFNVVSLGSTIIQFVFLRIGEKMFGIQEFKQSFIETPFFNKLPLVSRITDLAIIHPFAQKFSAYMIVYMLAVGVGMIRNFIIYSKIIWA